MTALSVVAVAHAHELPDNFRELRDQVVAASRAAEESQP